MKIQEVMMKKLDCSNWEKVQEQYPITSSYKALQEYFIVFRDWVMYYISYKHTNFIVLL